MIVVNKEWSINKDGNEIEKESVYWKEGRKEEGREEKRKRRKQYDKKRWDNQREKKKDEKEESKGNIKK